METELPPTELDTYNTRRPLARGTPEPSPIDGDAVSALEADLKKTITDGEVRFDAGTRAAYSTDGSNYRQVPIGVVVPRTIEDVIDTIRIARAHGAPILSRGGGTSLAGQCCNVALVIDWTKHLHHVLEIDPVAKTAWVEPGCVLDRLRNQALQYDVTFGPDPATHTHCTLGGMIGNNSCGMHAQMAGRTSDNVLALEVLLYDGTRMTVGATSDEEYAAIVRQGGRRADVYERLRRLRDRVGDLVRTRYPKIPRRISGYNLDDLLPERGFDLAKGLVGSEGTCVTILRAKLRLVDWPRARSLLVLGYEDVYHAADHVMEVLEAKPMALEGIDQKLIEDIRKKKLHAQDLSLFPDGEGFLILEFGGATKQESDDRARALMARLKAKPGAPSMKLYDDPEQEHHVWLIRESGLGATARVPGEPDTWEGWEDSAVPPEELGGYLRELKQLYRKFDYDGALYGHFGQGCVHTRINFGLTSAEGIRKFRAFVHEAAELCLRHGGSLSGEHGDGQSRAELLPKMFGEELIDAFREFKSIWDPEWRMNPGKVVNAYRLDENLRLGADYRPWDPKTYFAFPEDDRSFARASLRCVGVGECRREEGGTMCPSYMATREELHSTRGRAHVLHEMLTGDVVTDRWRSEAVHDALDLCLSCKGCKSDCPMNVDMATYKAEFLAHYWKGRLRPRHAYAMGFIHDWAKLASIAPRVANFFGQTPGLRGLAKLAAGVSPKRELPRFAERTFRDWFLARERRPNAAGPTVVLYPDTFVDFFHPEIGVDAVEVMERLGFRVVIPRERLCCGRPLYDYGFLERARRLLRKNLRALRRAMHEGWPIVVLEPSCAAVFRDELGAMFPNDADAKRLEKQVVVFSELVQRHAPDFAFPKLEKKALLHGHCHHKSVMKMDDEHALLERLGLEFDEPATGCCGMAGSFGFEAEKYELSKKVARHVLLPKVEELEGDALLVADGFSCRTQVEQLAGRRGLHVAQVARLALAVGDDVDAPHGHEKVSDAEQRTVEKT